MKVKLTLEYYDSNLITESLSLMLTKANGDNFQVITFSGVDILQYKDDIDIGNMLPSDCILCSVIGIRCVLSLNYEEVMNYSKQHIFNISNSNHSRKVYATITLKFMPSLDEKFEKAIQFIEDYSLPWFLKSSSLYNVTKISVTAVTSSDNRTAYIINQFANFAIMYTLALIKAVKPMLAEQEVAELICSIDEFLLKYLTFFDSMVDSSKVNIAHLLRAFKNAVIEHSTKFKIVLDKQVENAKVVSSQVVTTVNSSVDKSVVYVSEGVYPAVVAPFKATLMNMRMSNHLLLQHTAFYLQLLSHWLCESSRFVHYTVQNVVHKTYDHTLEVAQYAVQTASPYVGISSVHVPCAHAVSIDACDLQK